ncbi:DUF2589 domain-containing protein [Nocardioides coralli]|uniref:DUF2589 domain-containing protein n=1 Tax=Nocardioides coralli TaxID=2872154 RepID=UPI001CA46003|nr:DUF2589 domain-containing protein [Nocardioides coralli]QZY28961.1 DUF2589 domain-containing protein [Nocardioides coralli]
MAVTDIKTLGLGELLGSLLTAIVEGQTAATSSSLDFVERVGLSDDAEHPAFRTVTIRYTKLDENQEPAEFELELPLLALVTIPTITVKQAKVAFTYDVVTTTKEATSTEKEGDELIVANRFERLRRVEPVRLVGFVTRRTTTSTDSTAQTGIDVEVTVESEALPLGLERLLELAELAHSRPVEDDQ